MEIAELNELKKIMKETHTIVQGKPNASHEDVRGAFNEILEFLGYSEKNRLHERLSKAGKCDLRLMTDEGLVHAIVEFKSPKASFDKIKLRDYMYDLRVKYGFFSDGNMLIMYELVLDELKELSALIFLDKPDDSFVIDFYNIFRKPKSPLTVKSLLELLGGIEARPIPLSENRDEFISKFQLSPTPFAELVFSTFRLYKFLAEDPSSFTYKTFKIWRSYFAPTTKERGAEKRFKSWRQALTSILGREPKEKEFYEFMFSLETAYALMSRLMLLRLCGDYGFGVGIGWMRDECKNMLKDPLLRTLSSGSLYVYMVGQIPKQFVRMAFDFPSIFEEDFFDWWHDAFSRTALDDVVQGNIPEPIVRFSSSVLVAAITISSFSFKGVTSDILGSLYQEYFDPSTRKALGEFYTPPAIVEYIIDRVGYKAGNGITLGKMLIDPACGSGTFLIKAIERYFEEARNRAGKDATWEELLTNLCDGLAICGLDVNPFAVIVAQVNFAMQIIPHYGYIREKNPRFRISGIPVFKTDTLRLPLGEIPLEELLKIKLPIGEKDSVEFFAPSMKMLRSVGAINLVEAVKLLRSVYKAARRAVEERDIDKLLEEEVGTKKYVAFKSNPKLMQAFFSITKALRDLKDRVGDKRLAKWVGDELVVAILKFEPAMKYDYIVCNPPYVTAYRADEELKMCKELKYELVQGAGKRDLAHPFLEWGIRRARPSGKIGYIMTDKWIEWAGRGKIRYFVLNNTRIVEIIDSSWVEFFDEAANATAIVILESNKWDHSSPLRIASLFREPVTLYQAKTTIARNEALRQALNLIKDALDKLELQYLRSVAQYSLRSDFFVGNVISLGDLRTKDISNPRNRRDNYPLPWTWLLRTTLGERKILELIVATGRKLKYIEDFLKSGKRKFFEGIVTAGYPVFLIDEVETKHLQGEQLSHLELTGEGSDIERWGIIYKQRGTKEVAIEPGGKINFGLVKRTSLMKEKRIILPYTWNKSNNEWQRIDIKKHDILKKIVTKKAERILDQIKTGEKGNRVEKAVEFLRGKIEDDEFFFIDKRSGKYVERKPSKALGYKAPRLICRDISRWNSFHLDLDARVYPVNTCYFLVLKSSDGKEPIANKALYYLGLLNSSVIEFYHKVWSSAMPGVGIECEPRFRYRVETVERYPLIQYCGGLLDKQIISIVEKLMTSTSLLNDDLITLQRFMTDPVDTIRNLIDQNIDFALGQKITVKLEKLEVEMPTPLSQNDENRIKQALADLVDRINIIAREICTFEKELDGKVIELYSLKKEEADVINAFLQRLRA